MTTMRANDGGQLDLYRHPGHPAGHLRDPGRGRPGGISAPERKNRRHGRSARHGRRPAAGRDHEWRCRPRRGSRSGADREAAGDQYLDESTADVEQAIEQRGNAPCARRRATRSAWSGNAAEVFPRSSRGFTPDVITDQTSAHDPLVGYVPDGLSLADAARLRATIPTSISAARSTRWAATSRPCASCKNAARSRSITATTSAQAVRPACATRSRFPASSPNTSGRCSARAKARSAGWRCRAIRGHHADRAAPVRATRPVPLDSHGRRAGADYRFAGADLLARLRRPRALRSEVESTGARRRDQGADRDRPRSSRHRIRGFAQPRDEGMPRGTATRLPTGRFSTRCSTPRSGATWVSVHHGGGVGIGYSIHAGMVIVADGTREADERLARVLTCDPGTGVVRHADAGYPEAIQDRANTDTRIPHAGDEPMTAPTPASNGACSPRSAVAAHSRGHRRVRHRPHHAVARAHRPHGSRTVPAWMSSAPARRAVSTTRSTPRRRSR